MVDCCKFQFWGLRAVDAYNSIVVNFNFGASSS